jgi:type VI secretion system secreted protein VgrG
VAIASPVELTLRAGPLSEADLAVSRVEGEERLSAPYRFVVEAWSADGAPFDLEAVLGREATLRLRRAGLEERVVHGEVHAAELVLAGAGSPLYRLTIRPRLARLGVGARSRVFQERTVPEIVAAVLDGWKVKHRSALAGTYPKREMTLQHRESDLAFVSRLLEAEGIWYRFEHAADGHELVLADGKGAYVQGGSVAYAHSDLGAGTGSVTRVERTARLVPGTAASRDYDFERPMLEVSGKAQEGDGPEVYEWPGGYRGPAEGKRLARTRLEELRHGAETFEGKGTSLVPAPGTTLGLEGFAELLAVRVVHRAEQGRARGGDARTSYENAFDAIDAGRPYRPRRRTPWPRMAGIQTATVVVPAGEEVHTERHERVKVRFRWDREGKADDTASAWVRLAQPWAGAGMGAAFVPRVGQEVVIRFLDGDPDRPIVVGAVYNGQNVPPLELPHQKTRSTVRTASSPGSEGYNELRFEDDAGREQVFLHAERDRELEVRAEEERAVRGSAALTVDEDRTKRVLGSQRLDVARDDTRAVGTLETTTVAIARTVTVAGSHDERVGAVQAVTVGGAQSVMVGAASVVTVGAAAALNVGGGYAVNVGGALNQLVVGVKSTEIGGASLEAVGAHREERVVGEKSLKVGEGWDGMVHDGARLATDGDETWTVSGKAAVAAGPRAAIEAQSELLEAQKLTIEVAGKPVIVVDAQGNVTFVATNLTLDGSEIALQGSKVAKIQPDAAQKNANWVELELLDEEGKGVGNARYELHLADGSVKKGSLDGSGKARVDGLPAGACRVVFPDEEKRKK